MNDSPLFVIVLPTYTRSKLLLRALVSIKEQDYANWMCVIVNDGSTDDTDDCVKDFVGSDERYIYIKQENKGVNAARNAGIDEVAKLIDDCFYIFIDDDDYLADHCLSKASSLIKRNLSYSWFGFNCINMETNKKISKLKKYGANNYISDLMFGRKWRGDITSFIHSSIIGDLRFCTEIKNGEEWYFWSQLAIKNDVYIEDEPGSYKEYLPAGLTKTGFNRDKAIEVLKYKIEILVPVVGKRKMVHQFVSLAKNYLLEGNYEEAFPLLSEVFKISPFYLRQYRHWVSLFIKKYLNV